jgi:antitoxin component of RelBE/YafQ-DinJ toxin-antitoxin module
MQAQITVRLSDEIAAELAAAAEKLHCRRSDVIRLALERFIREDGADVETRPYDRVRDLLGSVTSGVPDLGEAHQEHLGKKFRRDG